MPVWPDPTYQEIAKEMEKNVTVKETVPEDTEVELSCGNLEAPAPIKKPAKIAKQPHQSRKGVPNWESEEERIIQSASGRNQAWTLYQGKFPGKRNANAVKQKWSKMCLSKKEEAPKVEKKVRISTLESPKTDTKVEKGDRRKMPGKIMKCPYCEKLMDTRILHQHGKRHHRGKYNVSDVSAYIKGKNIITKPDKAEFGVPDNQAATVPHFTTPPEQFKIDDHVRQIKKYQDRQVTGIGVVKGFKNGLVEVNFNGSQYYKIDPKCLEVV
jgi:hypothetical protein